ncbi:hypothetical protein [Acidimangrovimonas sediminis]|uniref:hypothetical protein n=1 Tax=Acidimangrovimonas sediminis TaxID=2056283 RepID=UPI000C80E90A|nr:hypothetical protein [Acidimangrovimonas sediminis]
MAIVTRSTPHLADKAPTKFTHTPISSLFSKLVVALTGFIEAERDIEDVDIWEPAFAIWLSTAEQAQTRVTTLISAIRATAPARLADRPLQRMTLLIDGILQAESQHGLRQHYQLLERFGPLFQVEGNDVVAYRANQLLQAARQRVDDMVDLECLSDMEDCPAYGAPVGPEICGLTLRA